MSTNLLKLIHLADSAFPIGATSHSFGVETLAAEGQLRAPQIEHFLTEFLWENGRSEALFCRLAHRCSALTDPDVQQGQWHRLNQTISATKPARESRVASTTLGRRFAQTVAHLEEIPQLRHLTQRTPAPHAATEIHYCAAFGLVAGYLDLAEGDAVLAYLQQNAMGIVSACQRLLPIGQARALEILWHLKAVCVDVGVASHDLLPERTDVTDPLGLAHALDELTLFGPLLDLGSMRHPTLSTRLFIS